MPVARCPLTVLLPAAVRFVFLALLFLFLAACASAPTQEMSDARQSVEAALDAGADRYAAVNLRNAEEYLRKAERELELRFFSRARHDAIVARSEALKARDVALAIKAAQEAIDAASETGSVAPGALARARETLRKALAAAERGRTKRALELAAEARRLAGADD